MGIAEEDETRLAVIKYLYDVWQNGGEAPGMQFEEIETIAVSIGRPEIPVTRAVEYLEGFGLVKFMVTGPVISLTWEGVAEVERALRNPDEATDYLAPINVLNVTTMIGSQVQQGTSGSEQIGDFDVSLTQEDVRHIESWLAELEDQLEGLGLSVEDREEVAAQIATLSGQLKSKKPRRAIVAGALSALRTILIGGATTAAGHALIQHIPGL